MERGWTKAEKAAKRRELAAWIALKKAQAAKAMQDQRAELKRAIAEKRQQMMRPPRGPGRPPAAPALGYETSADFVRRKKPKKKRAVKKHAAPRPPPAPKKKKTRRAKRR